MGLRDLFDRLAAGGGGDAGPEVDEERAARLADGAADPEVTADALTAAGERTRHPLITYVEDDEQPEYVFRGGTLMVDNGDSLARQTPTRELAVVVTDSRFLFVVGGRLSDSLFEVPFEHVAMTYVDDEDERTYLVVDADRDGDELTFFADVTMDPRLDALRSAVERAENAPE
ncbi:hypothetical protein [Halosimplex salinum]|uniref:hypothetical protein n=1 Tax=Halosimplex salinum TaxID=1710538 RepID=UPI0013DDF236|nr:hypothetical protein [Halosimplex salinum]